MQDEQLSLRKEQKDRDNDNVLLGINEETRRETNGSLTRGDGRGEERKRGNRRNSQRIEKTAGNGRKRQEVAAVSRLEIWPADRSLPSGIAGAGVEEIVGLVLLVPHFLPVSPLLGVCQVPRWLGLRARSAARE